MLYFLNDYSEGTHPKILETLVKTNLEQTAGYGEDKYSKEAKEIIKKKIECENANIYFLVGGTQTNLVSISHFLRPYEAVIACKTGHISVHETGAIEATGHKVIEVEGKNFKITIENIKRVLENNQGCHTVEPKIVYISNTTEMGTTYNKKELEEISKICRENNLYLFLDGARLASALASENSDLELKDYAKYCDAFYLGGTKSGLLFGEALVIVNDKLKENFSFSIKQKGGLLAKGRLLGLQFKELFKDNLYFELGKHSNEMAKKIKNALVERGIDLVSDSYSNQIFFYLSKEKMDKLATKVYFDNDFESDRENEKIVRFVTSWATKEEDVDKLVEIIKNL